MATILRIGMRIECTWISMPSSVEEITKSYSNHDMFVLLLLCSVKTLESKKHREAFGDIVSKNMSS